MIKQLILIITTIMKLQMQRQRLKQLKRVRQHKKKLTMKIIIIIIIIIIVIVQKSQQLQLKVKIKRLKKVRPMLSNQNVVVQYARFKLEFLFQLLSFLYHVICFYFCKRVDYGVEKCIFFFCILFKPRRIKRSGE